MPFKRKRAYAGRRRKRGRHVRTFRAKTGPRRGRARYSMRTKRLASKLRRYLSELKWIVKVVAARASPLSLSAFDGGSAENVGGNVQVWDLALGNTDSTREGNAIRAKGMKIDFQLYGGLLTTAAAASRTYHTYRLRMVILQAKDEAFTANPSLLWAEGTDADEIFTAGYNDAARGVWKPLYSKTWEVMPHSGSVVTTPQYNPGQGYQMGTNEPKPRATRYISKYIPLKGVRMLYANDALSMPVRNNVVIVFGYDMLAAQFSSPPSIWGQVRIAYYDD